jgi:aminoglycoside phosphotransferase (APT) family kinase protein
LAELEKATPLRLTPSGRQTLERYRDALLERIPAEALRATWIHADYCPENIIVGYNGLTVLDYTMSKNGTAYHDIAHLFFRIDAMRLKPWTRQGAIARVQRELLDGFEPGLDTSTPLFALMLFQHVLCHMVALQGSGLAAILMHRRHRRWLERTAGLSAGSWAR